MLRKMTSSMIETCMHVMLQYGLLPPQVWIYNPFTNICLASKALPHTSPIPSQLNMQHLAKIKQLKKTLAFQRDVQVFRQIPKRYRPSAMLETPTESQSALTTEFQHESEKLFFDHLSKVITFNTISLELELAQLRHSGRLSDCTCRPHLLKVTPTL